MMDIDGTAQQLREYLLARDLKKTQDLLKPINDVDIIRAVEEKFRTYQPSRDPVNFAIDCGDERIAIYLVEKAFSVDCMYQQQNEQCDQWCLNDHGSDKCPTMYDAADHAGRKNLMQLKNLIDRIKQGERRPGEGLSDLVLESYMTQGGQTMEESRIHSDRDQAFFYKQNKSDAEKAKELLEEKSATFMNRDGNTMLHLSVDQPHIYTYVFANAGIPVNIQNNDGDTALHLAVRKKRLGAVESLLQCSADPTIRNKMGQTPSSLAEGEIRSFLDVFRIGIVAAVCEGKSQSLDRIVKRLWCSTETKVKEGRNIIELAESRAEANPNIENCLRILKEYRKTSRLIHAVLCEDVEMAKWIISDEKGWSVNVRFRDRLGKTLLSHAVESGNLEMVQLLVNNGARVNHIRVREHEATNVTLPLFHKSLRRDLDPNIAKFLHSVQDSGEHLEKDCSGNTALLRAIEEGCSPKMVTWLIQCTKGQNLVHRNMDGLTARELAAMRNRPELVSAIDTYILEKMGLYPLPQFPINFYPEDSLFEVGVNLNKTKSLRDLIDETEDKYNMKKWLNFKDTESQGVRLFGAAACGDVETVKSLSEANFKDRNGYTALIRAVVYNQIEVVQYICSSRPSLKSIPDNCNRYPLHYAYALPPDQGQPIIRLLLHSNPHDIDKKVDKNGMVPAEYGMLRGTEDMEKMLHNARTLDAYGKIGEPLGPWTTED